MSAAAHLCQAGIEAQVFDKARGPGGRSASRRQEPLRFDHGAPLFHAQDPVFLSQVSEWVSKGLVAPWTTTITTQDNQGQSQQASQGFVAVPKMSALARAIGQDAPCHYSTRIANIEPSPQGWRLTDTEAQTYHAKQVLLTAPPPQTLELLAEHSPTISSALNKVEVQPDWTLMLSGEPDLLPAKVGQLHFKEHPCLSQLTAEHRKPQRPSEPAWTLHANAAWSRTHEEAERPWVIEQLCAALGQSLGRSLNFATAHAHRWRYARVRKNVQEPYLADQKTGLYYAGDACQNGDLESAYLSGLAAAQAIASTLSAS